MAPPKPLDWDVWKWPQVDDDVAGVRAPPVKWLKAASLAAMRLHDKELLKQQRDFNHAVSEELKHARALIADLTGRIQDLEARVMFPRTVTRRYRGTELKLHLPDKASADWYDFDHPRYSEYDFLLRWGLRPGATVFDIGAHQAVVSSMLARLVGKAGKVVAVEPLPENCDAARINRSLNGLDWLEVVHAACGAQPGTIKVGDGPNGKVDLGFGYPNGFHAEGTTVDALALKYGAPHVLCLDVLGYECKVLEGCSRVLGYRPALMIKVDVGDGLEKLGGSTKRLLELIPGDYRFWACKEGAESVQPFGGVSDPIAGGRFILIGVCS